MSSNVQLCQAMCNYAINSVKKMLENRSDDALGLLVKLENLVKLFNLAKHLNLELSHTFTS